MNAAQTIHESLGVPTRTGHKQAHGDKNPSATKGGPGRYHAVGHEKDRPHKTHGASAKFVLHTNPAKKNRRDRIKALGGIRQFKRWERSVAKNAPEGY